MKSAVANEREKAVNKIYRKIASSLGHCLIAKPRVQTLSSQQRDVLKEAVYQSLLDPACRDALRVLSQGD